MQWLATVTFKSYQLWEESRLNSNAQVSVCSTVWQTLTIQHRLNTSFHKSYRGNLADSFHIATRMNPTPQGFYSDISWMVATSLLLFFKLEFGAYSCFYSWNWREELFVHISQEESFLFCVIRLIYGSDIHWNRTWWILKVDLKVGIVVSYKESCCCNLCKVCPVLIPGHSFTMCS